MFFVDHFQWSPLHAAAVSYSELCDININNILSAEKLLENHNND